MPDNFDIPETDRIGAMMDDLFDGPAPARPTPPPRRTQPPRAPGRHRPRLGPVTLARFADGVNWTNVAGFESTLVPPPPPRIAGLTLGTFADGVNWRNTAAAAAFARKPPADPATAPQPTVDAFLSEFAWD